MPRIDKSKYNFLNPSHSANEEILNINCKNTFFRSDKHSFIVHIKEDYAYISEVNYENPVVYYELDYEYSEEVVLALDLWYEELVLKYA
jgi:hypothetical protein